MNYLKEKCCDDIALHMGGLVHGELSLIFVRIFVTYSVGLLTVYNRRKECKNFWL